jgi:serine/threonine protein kinase
MLVMEQAPLGSLFGLLHAHSHRSAPLEMPMALRVCLAADCCSVVTFLHAKGIVHRLDFY